MANITYIQTRKGRLYLAGILDLYSGKVVRWALSGSIASDLVLSSLSMPRLHRNPPSNLLFHFARGVQYAAGSLPAALAQASLVPSMSRRRNFCDNAAMESFWSTLMLELLSN